MPFSEDSKVHVRHILELETLMLSSPSREYSSGNEPAGYLEYWEPHFVGLFLVSVYIYINEIVGSEKFWNTSAAFNGNPMLVRCLEAMRHVRNAIVHNGGVAKPVGTSVGDELRDFEAAMVSSQGVEVDWQGKPVRIHPFYTIEDNGEIKLPKGGLWMIRFLAVAALETEGKINVIP